MSEGDEEERVGGGAEILAFAAEARSRPEPAPPTPASPHRRDVAFDRRELSEILRVYGRMVAAGEWRDYAIDHMKDKAVFSVFRRTAEVPLYRIEKEPALARRQGAYSVVAPGGYVMKRGHDLAQVLRVVDRKPKLVDA